MKRIMLISNSFGSLFNFRYELIMTLLKSYEVTLATPMIEADYKNFEAFRSCGCHLVDTAMERRGKNPIQELDLQRRYRKLLKEHRPDLVLTYTIKPNIYAGIACQKLKIPYLATVTGLGTAFEKKGLLQGLATMLYKKSFQGCHTVFFQNESSMQWMKQKGIRKGESTLVPGSGINLNRFTLQPYPTQDIYLYMARIMKEKGAEEFLYSAEKMKELYPQIQILVVGFCEEAYEERIKMLQQRGILTYFGWRDDPETFLAQCSCLINPSYHEGMSNACLEAAAMGRPILASDIPGCKETVTPEKTGMLFPAANAEALFDTWKAFQELSLERKCQMGQEGRKKMEQEFDRKLVVDAYCTTIESVLKDDTK